MQGVKEDRYGGEGLPPFSMEARAMTRTTGGALTAITKAIVKGGGSAGTKRSKRDAPPQARPCSPPTHPLPSHLTRTRLARCRWTTLLTRRQMAMASSRQWRQQQLLIRGSTQLQRRDADRRSDCRPPSLRYGMYRDGYHTHERQQTGISPDQLQQRLCNCACWLIVESRHGNGRRETIVCRHCGLSFVAG
jgi:hypothetical protein